MPSITGNVFEENLVNAGGGAIAVGNNAAPVISQNVLRHNEASQGGAQTMYPEYAKRLEQLMKTAAASSSAAK